jgi:Zn-dependent protease
MNEFLSEILLLAPPLLFALTIHELAHGMVAYGLGDPTAKLAGRLTLNPLKHLDPIGTLAFFLIKFGWAKPVPVNPGYFRRPKQDMLWVALAGPLSNLILAVISALLIKVVQLLLHAPLGSLGTAVLLPLGAMLVASVWINLILAVFNCLPIPPLDGGRILAGLLPDDMARVYRKLEPYGFVLVLLLSFTGLISQTIVPIVRFANSLLLS